MKLFSISKIIQKKYLKIYYFCRCTRWWGGWCPPGTRTATCRPTSPPPADSSRTKRFGRPSSITSSTTTPSRTSRPGSSAPPPSRWVSRAPMPQVASGRFRCSWMEGRRLRQNAPKARKMADMGSSKYSIEKSVWANRLCENLMVWVQWDIITNIFP